MWRGPDQGPRFFVLVERMEADMVKKATELAAELVVVGGAQTGGPTRIQRARRNSFGTARQALFFMRLSETSNVTEACRTAGVANQTAYKYRNRYAEFAARWEQALADGVADLRMKVVEQGRFGQTSECVVSTDEKGVRRIQWKREIAPTALRTLAQVAARTHETDAEIVAMNEARDRQIEVEAAAELLSRAVGTLPDDDHGED